MNYLSEALNILKEINTFDKLGGRDDFFGMKFIFETILKDEHKKKGLTDSTKQSDPFYYKGIRQYGNIVDWNTLLETLPLLLNKYNFNEDNLQQLSNWYKEKSIDCAVICTGIEHFLGNI